MGAAIVCPIESWNANPKVKFFYALGKNPITRPVNTPAGDKAMPRLSEHRKGAAMDELRVVRREEHSLILANELGKEYRIAIDESVLQEVRQALPRQTGQVKARPREIQSLLREGKSRAQVAVATGVSESDVERFEGPVRAEQKYMLDLAHAVVVRTDPAAGADTPSANGDEQRFGEVIAERLIGLGNTVSIWRSWRDEEAGWMIGLEFDSRDAEHDAIWSFDHKKRVLSPLTADATNLSKIGDIGDRLIPKLRAVDPAVAEAPAPERIQAPFDPDALLAPTAEVEPLPASAQAPQATVSEATPLSADAEYVRRREIDHLAVSTPSDNGGELSQTADLLDALRRRRGERAAEAQHGQEQVDQGPVVSAQRSERDSPADRPVDTDTTAPGDAAAQALGLAEQPEQRSKPSSAPSIWGGRGISASREADAPAARTPAPQAPAAPAAATEDERTGAPVRQLRPTGGSAFGAFGQVDQGSSERPAYSTSSESAPASREAPQPTAAAAEDDAENKSDAPARDSRAARRGRSSIPSWDDILFGTRSEDDPA